MPKYCMQSSRSDKPWRREFIQCREGRIYLLKEEDDGKFAVNRIKEDDGQEERVGSVQSAKDVRRNALLAPAHVHVVQARPLLSSNDTGEVRLLLGHADGTLDLHHLHSGSRIGARYSPHSADNHLREMVLTETFFGAAAWNEKAKSKCGYVVFDSRTGAEKARGDELEAYGRVYFSASDRYSGNYLKSSAYNLAFHFSFFVFSYADALYNQHFFIHDFHGKGSQPRKVSLNDR